MRGARPRRPVKGAPGNREAGKTRAIALLVAAEVLAMALWFTASATLADLVAETGMSPARAALLSSAVAAGFVVGALGIAITGLADRLDPRRVFAAAGLAAALANALPLVVAPDGALGVAARAAVGLCLAGVYPVGMKIAVGWGLRDRGLLVGLLVGGLTLGSAAPHLLAFLGGADWRTTTLAASALAAAGAALVLATSLGPHHARAPRFDARAATLAWSDVSIRRAFAGYLGHMWELYAMWAWIGTALAASYALRMDPAEAAPRAKLTAFAAIAVGAVLCPVAGAFADRVGKARLTVLAMAASGAAALAAAATFGGPAWLFAAVVVVWGAAIIPDSAQFSALVADAAPPDRAGSLLTLQTALGFALTVATVQALPSVVEAIGWRASFVVLALGPAVGIVSVLPLARAERAARRG